MSVKRKIEVDDDDAFSSALRCTICSAIFVNPKQLPECGHCFCFTCLVKSEERPEPSTPVIDNLPLEPEGSTLIVCPTCRTKNILCFGSEGLPTNVPLLALSNHFRKRQQLAKTTRADPETDFCSKLPCFEKNDRADSAIPSTPQPTPTERCESVPISIQMEKLRCQSSASVTSEQSSSEVSNTNNRCCSFYIHPQPRVFCHHCKDYFCKRCELMHLEMVKAEVVKFGNSVTLRMSNLPSTATVATAADDIFNKLSLDLEQVEKDITAAAMNAYQTVSRALQENGERLLAEANANVHQETERIEKLVEKWNREGWRTDVIRQINDACKEIKAKSLMEQSLESISTVFYYMSKLEQDVIELEKLCRPLPEEAQIAFYPSTDFANTINSLGTEAPLGSVSAVRSSSSFASLTSSNSAGSQVQLAVTPTCTPCPTAVYNFDKAFYENLHATAIVSGLDCFQWDLKKPTCICYVPHPDEPMAAFIHNGTRVSLVAASSGELKHSFRLRIPLEEGEVYLGHYIAATENLIFVTCQFGLRIIQFSYINVKTPKGTLTRVFTRTESENVRFSGLAVCLKRQELYSATKDAIVAYSVRDGTVSFRCAFQEQSQIGTSQVYAVFSDTTSTNIIYTSQKKFAWTFSLPSSGPLSNSESSAVKLPLSSDIKEHVRIQHITADPAGNILVSYPNFKQIKVYAQNASEPIVTFSPANLQAFDPAKFVIVPGEFPKLIVASFSANAIVTLSP